MSPIIQLIQITLGKRSAFEGEISPPAVALWLKEAKKQSLIGVLSPAIKQLLIDGPRELRQPLFNWMANALKIEDKNKEMNQKLSDVVSAFSSAGIETVVLKGQGVAALYPNPLWRSCGDIDLWVRGDRSAISEKLPSLGEVKKVLYYHTEMCCFGDTEVEVHFHPSWFNDPLMDRRFNRWLDSVADSQFSRDIVSGFRSPDCYFNLVYCFVHIFKHIFSEGVGLRQIMDYYYILLHSEKEQRNEASKVLKSFGMGKTLGALMYILKKVFILDEEYFLEAPSEKYGNILLEKVLLGGNFGKSNPTNVHGRENDFQAGLRKIKISLESFFLCPREVIWLPVYKIWHLHWRKTNNK